MLIGGFNNTEDDQLSPVNYSLHTVSDAGMNVTDLVQDLQTLSFTFKGLADTSKINST